MKKSKLLVLGLIALVLAGGLVLASCDGSGDGGGIGGGGSSKSNCPGGGNSGGAGNCAYSSYASGNPYNKECTKNCNGKQLQQNMSASTLKCNC